MDEYLSRIRDRLDRRHIAQATIAIVGIGSVGGLIAVELGRLIPRGLILVDGGDYEEENRVRHPLPREYVGTNKAVAMADYLNRQYPWISNITPIPHDVSTDDMGLVAEDVIDPASVVIVSTDDLEIQRHVSLWAREFSTPAIVPGVGEDGEVGEVFVSLTTDRPCILCFDSFRGVGDPVRAASAMATDLHPTVQLSVQACLGLLAPTSREGRIFEPPEPGMPPPQYFRAYPPGSRPLQAPDDGRTQVPWRDNCPWCGGSPDGGDVDVVDLPALPPKAGPPASQPARRETTAALTPRSIPSGLAAAAILILLLVAGVSALGDAIEDAGSTSPDERQESIIEHIAGDFTDENCEPSDETIGRSVAAVTCTSPDGPFEITYSTYHYRDDALFQDFRDRTAELSTEFGLATGGPCDFKTVTEYRRSYYAFASDQSGPYPMVCYRSDGQSVIEWADATSGIALYAVATTPTASESALLRWWQREGADYNYGHERNSTLSASYG